MVHNEVEGLPKQVSIIVGSILIHGLSKFRINKYISIHFQGLLMYKTTIVLIFLLFVAFTPKVTAQPMPISWSYNLQKNPRAIALAAINYGDVRKSDSLIDNRKDIPFRYGIVRELNLNMDDGTWTELPDGGKIWQLNISSPGAVNLSANLDRVFLPAGSRIQVYGKERGNSLYTFLSSDLEQSRFGTWPVDGDVIYLEYYQPPHTQQLPQLEIVNVIHGYRMGERTPYTTEGNRINGSGPCNYDVNCSIGSDFDPHKDILKKSVALINLGNGFLCTGVLLNNTSADKTPYLLTADHCLMNSDPSYWSFRFNWVSPAPVCGTGEPSGDLQNNFTLSGAQLIANNPNSDFALVKLYNNIPDSWDVTFAGWDNSDNPPIFEVGIHHPQGDIMKICRDNSGAEKVDANGTQTWLIGGGEHGSGNGWEIGTTESGSSGSPLFNEHGRLIGQLYAGEAGCNGLENNHEYDLYGRFGVSWGAGETPENRLQEWLDPINTGQSTMESLQNILNIPSFEAVGELKIYPNPAAENITIENYRFPHLIYLFYDVTGKNLLSGSAANTLNTISVAGFAEGVYFLRLEDEDSNDSVTKKIIVQR